jgi:4-hydroxybenzoate polyprenyltransferase
MAWLTVLGIPAAVYVMCVAALMYQVNGRPQNPLLLLGAGVLTAGIYIFHRTSAKAIEPMQERHRLAIRHKKMLLLVSLLLFIFAIAVFAFHHPLSTILVFGSLAGVIAYGRKTVLQPLRMFPYLKSISVGIAITLFAWVLNDFSNSWITLLAFMLICSADALMCDLSDTEYDRATGCQTLASRLGSDWTWIIATAVYLFASIGMLYAVRHSIVGFFFFIVFIVSLAGRKLDSRFLVDFRLLFVLLLAWGGCMLLNGLTH